MIANIIACLGEAKKQIINYQLSTSNLLSLFIWPLISFFFTYYTYRSFDIVTLHRYNILTENDFWVFILTGALVYNGFWSMVQSAFFLTFERTNGTLELLLLSPIHTVYILYGRSLGGLLSSTWMFMLFSIIGMLFILPFSVDVLIILLFSFILLVISSIVWGGFMNALFLVSRDSTFMFSIFNEPMELFTGIKIPVKAFPVWGQTIASLFPATYCLMIIRSLFGIEVITNKIVYQYLFIMILIIFLTVIIVNWSEKNATKNGSYTLY